jgi:hypothetical protein
MRCVSVTVSAVVVSKIARITCAIGEIAGGVGTINAGAVAGTEVGVDAEVEAGVESGVDKSAAVDVGDAKLDIAEDVDGGDVN